MDRVAFLHIPKTAGVTIREEITKYYDSSEIHHVLHPNKWVPERRVKEAKFIHGHFGWRVANHDYFDGFKKILFIRDPLSRIRSLYNFLVGCEVSACVSDADLRRVEFAKSSTFEEFALNDVKGIKGGVCNQQTRFLTDDLKPGISDSDRIDMAISRLSQITVVGVVEKMQESLDLLSYELGILPINSNIKRNSSVMQSNYSPEFLEAVRDRNALDFMLFDEAKKILQRKLKILNGVSLEKLALDRQYINKVAQEQLELSFDSAIFGENWYERESNESFVWRFTGPNKLTRIYFPAIDSSPKVLNIYIPHVVDVNIFDEIKINFNGFKLAGVILMHCSGQYVLTSIINTSYLYSSNHNVLEIETDFTKKPAGLNDDRLLGIAVSKIELLATIREF